MVKRAIGCQLSAVSLIFILCSVCFGQVISSTELISNAKQYDGKPVVYTGEVIGEVMVRGKYAWLNVHDGKNAIGVWLPRDLTREIKFSGSYKFKGDEVEISGIFHRSCQEHGGDLDIHAQGLRKVNVGYQVPEKLDFNKTKTVLMLLGILGIVWILSLLKHH